jgi:hypothetical protein
MDDETPQTEQAAEKVSEGSVFVAQPLLAVWFLQHLSKAHSQEWLCYQMPSGLHVMALGRKVPGIDLDRAIGRKPPIDAPL